MSQKLKILITGAGGFLGSHIVKALHQKGYQNLYGLNRNHYPELDQYGVKQIQMDITNFLDLKKLFETEKFDVVFHVAAKAGVWGKYKHYHAINYRSTLNLLTLSENHGVKKFIYTSSPSVVIGDRDIINAREDNIKYPKRFTSAYAETKAMAEKAVLNIKSNNLQVAAIRPHLIWGPGDNHILPRVYARAVAGKLFQIGNGRNLVDVTYVENAADAHVQLLEKMLADESLTREAFFVGQERPVVLWKFIRDILATQNFIWKPSIVIPFSLALNIGQLIEWVYKILRIKKEPPMTRFLALQMGRSHFFSHSKAEKIFGYRPKVSIEEGLERLRSI